MNEQKSQEVFLYDLLYTIFKRKYLAVAIFLATFAGIIFGTYLVTPLWKATAKVRVQYNPKQQLNMFEGITTPGSTISGINPANDAIQILISRELAEEVAKRFERDKLWEKRVNAPEATREIIRWHIYDFLVGKPIRFLQTIGLLTPNPDNYLAMAVEELQEDLEDIELEEETTVVNVSVWGESPEIATAMSNALVELLFQKNLEASRRPVEEMISVTQAQIDAAEKNLKKAQENLRRFKEKSGLVLYNEEATILLQRLDQYKAELRNMESQLASLKIEKMASHPDVRSLEAKINEYRNVIIPGIEKDLDALPLKEVELARLNWELESRENLFNMLKEKLLELEALRDSSTGDMELKVIDPAKVYSFVSPDWPKWIINLPLGLMASVFVALGFVFVVEYWNNSFKSVKELEEDLHLNVLGAIPRFSLLGKRRIFNALSKNAAENPGHHLPVRHLGRRVLNALSPYDRLADSMLLKNGKPSGNIFLVTSPGPREGKTTTAAIISQILSRRGKKVLLVEADLRSPSLAGFVDVNNEKGLLDICFNDAAPKDLMMRLKGMDILFAGNPATYGVDPFEVISSEKFYALVRSAKTKYDFVIMDSPCVKRFRDPIYLASIADGVVLVVEADGTQRRSILMAVEKINNAGGDITGLVLNKQTDYVPEFIKGLLE